MNPTNPVNVPDPADRDLTDAEIEAIVAAAIDADASAARREAQPPSSAIVWWRTQMRARREAAQAAERPVTIVHALAIACGAGLLVSIFGTVFSGVKGSMGWLTGAYAAVSANASLGAIDFTSRWIMLPMTAMIICAIVASIAALVIFADE